MVAGMGNRRKSWHVTFGQLAFQSRNRVSSVTDRKTRGRSSAKKMRATSARSLPFSNRWLALNGRRDVPHGFQNRTLAGQNSRFDFGDRHPLRRPFPGIFQLSDGLGFEHGNVARHIGCAVESQAKLVAGNLQPGFLEHFAAESLFCTLAPSADSSRQRDAASVIALNDQEFPLPMDDGDGRGKGAEQWKPAVELQAGAGHDPKQAALDAFESRQRAKSNMPCSSRPTQARSGLSPC